MGAFKKDTSILNRILGKELLQLVVGNTIINESFLPSLSFKELTEDTVSFFFSDGFEVGFSTNDMPHSWGDGKLELFEKNDESVHKNNARNSYNCPEKIVSEIRIWKWEPTGFSLFDTKRICQVSFRLRNGFFVSIGFFGCCNNPEYFLSTGELCVSSSETWTECIDIGLVYEDIVFG